MVLVDTSVWVDYFRAVESKEAAYLRSLIENQEDLCVSGIILTEVLQGIVREGEYKTVKSMLDFLIFLPDSKASYELAAEIYRATRSKGETIRNTIDCLIAASAIMHHALLLQNDKDFLAIARFSKLKLVDIRS